MTEPFPCTPILDTGGPDAGPPPSASWINGIGLDGMVTLGGQFAADPAAAGGAVIALWGTQTDANCEVYTAVPTRCADNKSVVIIARSSNPPLTDGYVLGIYRDDAGDDWVGLNDGGGGLADWIVVYEDGDQIGLRCCEETIYCWYYKPATGWGELGSVTSTTTTTGGYIGMGVAISTPPDVDDLATRLDNFGGGTISNECCGIFPPPAPPYGVPPVRTPSFYQQTGLSIIATDPLMAANRSTWFGRLSDQVQTFRMEKRRIGGYWSAEANINMRSDEIEDWIERGLGRHVQVVDEALVVVWEGFINRIEAKLGKLTFTLGPLMDIANRVQVAYSTVDNSVSPPILGIRARTTAVNDLDSQAAYGIIQKILSTGGSTATEAAQNGNTYLVMNAWPPTGRQSTLLGGVAGDLTIEMLGYWHWLTAYVYNQTAATGAVNASAKLQAVLAASLNAGLFSTDYSRLTANTVQISQWEDEDRTAEDVVKAINALGTAAYATTNVGFYNNRQIVYEPAPTSIRYVQRVTGNDLLTDLIGGQVRPWNVTPGEWIFYADFLVGRLPPVTGTSLLRDPRCGLIEVVTVDNRYGLDINGIHVGTLDQMLAQQGLAGVGA